MLSCKGNLEILTIFNKTENKSQIPFKEGYIKTNGEKIKIFLRFEKSNPPFKKDLDDHLYMYIYGDKNNIYNDMENNKLKIVYIRVQNRTKYNYLKPFIYY